MAGLAGPRLGPLKVHPTNPRYFSNGSGQAVYLTGSHVHINFQDRGSTDPPPEFAYARYLDRLQSHNHNFIRLWVWESPRTTFASEDTSERVYHPMPYKRPGPGKALDDKPKFDLSQFDQTYFDRLRSRVIAAKDRGIYVSIMLFQGWSVWSYGPDRAVWAYHPFNGPNNINGIDGDLNRNDEGEEVHSLQIPAIVGLQKAYIRKVIDTVNDLENVLYEISNESKATSKAWQYELINYIRQYEAARPKQHPIGMTAMGDNKALFFSSADWISPHGSVTWDPTREPYLNDPLVATDKVSILDTDHLGFYTSDAVAARAWVWKSFARGHNPILMEDLSVSGALTATRSAMGHSRAYASKMNLAMMAPSRCSSTGYCLAFPGREYLVYQPVPNASFTLRLAVGTYAYEWFNPRTGTVARAGTINARTGTENFAAPFASDAVLYAKRL